MPEIKSFLGSSLGKKAVMAVSGGILFGFVLVHMAGNLKLYLGAEAFNHYAAGLREIGAPLLPHGGALWIARAVLLAAVVAHLVSAWLLTRQSRAARRERYQKPAYVQADYAVRTMRWGGVILLLFVIYHLLHLTWGTAHPNFQADNPYQNVVVGLGNWAVALVYLVANLALGFHLYHGVWSLGRSLGLSHAGTDGFWRAGARAFALVVTAGNVSFPIAVLSGVVK